VSPWHASGEVLTVVSHQRKWYNALGAHVSDASAVGVGCERGWVFDTILVVPAARVVDLDREDMDGYPSLELIRISNPGNVDYFD
jgi:hypothetical protein